MRVAYQGATAEAILPVAAASPAIFYRLGGPAVVNQDGTVNDDAHPAPRGAVVIVYGTGQGVVSPALSTRGDRASRSAEPRPQISASVGGQVARVDFAGMAPGFIGLLQLNIVVPDGAPEGSAALTFTVNGVSSDPAWIALQ